MKKIILVLLLSMFSFGAQEKINVYTYHNHAPFIINNNEGYTYKLVDYLNKQAEGKYVFEVEVIPRSRLNYILKPWINKSCGKTQECENNWMVVWVNHKWGFGKDSLKNFSWIDLLSDSNAIVSTKEKNIQYSQPSDLKGMKLAGISGHRYVGIDELVKKEQIERIDGQNEVENLKIVLANRVDVTLLPKSAFLYYQKQNNEFNKLMMSKVPHQSYLRKIMTKRDDLKEFLSKLDYNFISK